MFDLLFYSNDSNVDMELSIPRRVELAKVYPLPRSEDGLAIIDYHSHAWTNHGRFKVRRAVALAMTELSAVGKRLVQSNQKITRNIGIGVFVYCDTSRRMRAVNHGDAVRNAAFGDDFMDLRRDIVEIFAGSR